MKDRKSSNRQESVGTRGSWDDIVEKWNCKWTNRLKKHKKCTWNSFQTYETAVLVLKKASGQETPLKLARRMNVSLKWWRSNDKVMKKWYEKFRRLQRSDTDYKWLFLWLVDYSLGPRWWNVRICRREGDWGHRSCKPLSMMVWHPICQGMHLNLAQWSRSFFTLVCINEKQASKSSEPKEGLLNTKWSSAHKGNSTAHLLLILGNTEIFSPTWVTLLWKTIQGYSE